MGFTHCTARLALQEIRNIDHYVSMEKGISVAFTKQEFRQKRVLQAEDEQK